MKKNLTLIFSFLISLTYSQTTYTVNNLTDDPLNGSGLTGSIRYCINLINSGSGLDTIKFSPLTDNSPVIIDSTLRVYKQVSIIGRPNNVSILKASSLVNNGIVDLYNTTTGNFVIKNLKFISTIPNQSTGFGQDAGTDFDNILIESCQFDSLDFAVFLDFSKNFVIIKNCVFNSCNVGVVNQTMEKSIDVYNCRFDGSLLAAMFIQGQLFNLYNNIITNTQSGTYGSLYVSDPLLSSSGCFVTNNTIINNLQTGLKIGENYGNASSINVSNNIIYNNTPADFMQSLETGTVITNCINSKNIGVNTNAASTYTPTWFSNSNPMLDANHKPTSSSNNVINNANPITASAFDFENTAKIGNREIGAFEYNGCGTSSIVPIPGTFNICSGQTDTLDIYASITNSIGISYQWKLSTGGAYSNFGPNTYSFTINPTINSFYYCEVQCYGFPIINSDTVQVIVNPLTHISGTITTNPSTPVAGTVILYKYEPFNTKFDSITSQPIGVSGDYTFNSFAAGNYIVKAIPNLNNLQITYGDSAVNWKTAKQIIHGCIVNDVQNINVKALSTFTGAPIGSLSGTLYQGQKYGQRIANGFNVSSPGNPIGGIIVKGGKNPGGQMFVQSTSSTVQATEGQYTLNGFPANTGIEEYFILVDIPGLDTNGTYHKIISLTNTNFQGLDFVIDSAKINPILNFGVGLNDITAKHHHIKLFPNPTSNKVTVTYNLSESSNVKIDLCNVLGQTIKSILPSSEQEISDYFYTIPLNDYSAGIYFVKIKINQAESVIKLVITD